MGTDGELTQRLTSAAHVVTVKTIQVIRTAKSTPGVPIDIANCDTDQIIPGRFLRKVKSDPDYHRYLFHDLRFNQDGSEKDFVFKTSVGTPLDGQGLLRLFRRPFRCRVPRACLHQRQ